MTSRERVAAACVLIGFVLAVAAGYGVAGWPGGCGVGAVLLLGFGILLGLGDDTEFDDLAELAAEGNALEAELDRGVRRVV